MLAVRANFSFKQLITPFGRGAIGAKARKAPILDRRPAGGRTRKIVTRRQRAATRKSGALEGR